MSKLRSLALLGVLCFVAAASYADSVNTIPITGTAFYGDATTYGDYNIQGPGLSLFQALPFGPSVITNCTVGATCNLTWSPGDPAGFCQFCTSDSYGSLGSNVAQYLSPNLQFKGSAFYPGGDSLSMQFTVTGTITGYELINCTDGAACSLGPQEFKLYISGHGTELLSTQYEGGGLVPFQSVSASFTGYATPVTTLNLRRYF